MPETACARLAKRRKRANLTALSMATHKASVSCAQAARTAAGKIVSVKRNKPGAFQEALVALAMRRLFSSSDFTLALAYSAGVFK